MAQRRPPTTAEISAKWAYRNPPSPARRGTIRGFHVKPETGSHSVALELAMCEMRSLKALRPGAVPYHRLRRQRRPRPMVSGDIQLLVRCVARSGNANDEFPRFERRCGSSEVVPTCCLSRRGLDHHSDVAVPTHAIACSRPTGSCRHAQLGACVTPMSAPAARSGGRFAGPRPLPGQGGSSSHCPRRGIWITILDLPRNRLRPRPRRSRPGFFRPASREVHLPRRLPGHPGVARRQDHPGRRVRRQRPDGVRRHRCHPRRRPECSRRCLGRRLRQQPHRRVAGLSPDDHCATDPINVRPCRPHGAAGGGRRLRHHHDESNAGGA